MGSSSDGFSWAGIVAIVAAMFCYGSYFVPVKKYEIHDGIVYQWYQCSGIMLAGVACAVARSDWSQETPVVSTSGFYVAPEGLLSGLIFQVANFIATVSVKSFGLGNYYTVHQVTNLGVTFVVGVFGPDMGLPAKPPSNIPLAAVGFVFVLVGMLPVMFMEKEAPRAEPAEAAAVAPAQLEAVSEASLSATAEGVDRLRQLFPTLDPAEQTARPDPPAAVDDASGPRAPLATSEVRQERDDAEGARGRPRREGRGSLDRVRPPALTIPSFRDFNARTWDGTLGRPRLDEDLSPCTSFGGPSLVVKEAPDDPEPLEVADAALAVLGEQLLHRERGLSSTWRWLQGFVLSLIAGALYAGMYVPLLPWKARMKEAGIQVQGYDSFFSMCVGLYLASTVYLICGGAWKKYRGQRMEKSVLRPALLSGVIYAVASISFLYAMMVIPYAIGYALGVGGGLAVSLLWGTLVFRETTSRYNRRCVVCSFAGVSVGIALLGLSA